MQSMSDIKEYQSVSFEAEKCGVFQVIEALSKSSAI